MRSAWTKAHPQDETHKNNRIYDSTAVAFFAMLSRRYATPSKPLRKQTLMNARFFSVVGRALADSSG